MAQKITAATRLAKKEGPSLVDPTPLILVTMPGNYLLSHRVAPKVPSALEGLTTVFGMGTGVTLPVSSPSSLDAVDAGRHVLRRTTPAIFLKNEYIFALQQFHRVKT